MIRQYILGAVLALICCTTAAQTQKWQWLAPSDTLNKNRVKLLAVGGTAAYAATFTGLYAIWYKGYDLGGFRLYDDSYGKFDEWQKVDKAGHVLTTYAESYLGFKALRWAGVRHKKAVWLGAAIGMGLQTTIEVMDGFSEAWGFSVVDMTANTLGAGLFVAQELGWKEQRIMLKSSNTRPRYPNTPIMSADGTNSLTVRQIAHSLYGSNLGEAYLKDYNGATTWASANIASFLKLPETAKFPRWLNLAVGYGADGMYGAFTNRYTDAQGRYYFLRNIPRIKQYYLSFDVDFRKFKTRSRVLKTVFEGLSFVKVPSPTYEYTSSGKHKFHWLFW